MGQTETKVAQVTLKSTSDRSKTISIDNPKDNLSLNQIKSAFQPAIAGGWLLDNYGDTIAQVSEAKYNQVIKTQINGEPVVVSPSSINMIVPLNSSAETTVTVTNATIEGYNFENITNNDPTYSARVADDGLSIILKIKQNTAETAGTFDFVLILQQGVKVKVPVSFDYE